MNKYRLSQTPSPFDELHSVTDSLDIVSDSVQPVFRIGTDADEWSAARSKFQAVEIAEASVYLRQRLTTEELEQLATHIKQVPEGLRKLATQVAIAIALPEDFGIEEDSGETDLVESDSVNVVREMQKVWLLINSLNRSSIRSLEASAEALANLYPDSENAETT